MKVTSAAAAFATLYHHLAHKYVPAGRAAEVAVSMGLTGSC